MAYKPKVLAVIEGGTGLASTVANQILYSSATNTIAGLSTSNSGILVTSSGGVPSILAGPGTTGNVLQSNAAGAPSFSTATYPSTATGTGKVLIANGTNWVASTPTFPNAAGTTGNVLTSDGTNFLSSTPTGLPSGLAYVSVVLTSAQVKALHTTPITIVAAQGAGKVIIPISAQGKLTYGGSNVFIAGAGQTLTLNYATTPIAMNGILTNLSITSSSSMYCIATVAGLTNAAITSLENVAITVLTGSAITGNAANNNTITVSLMYYVVTI